jgi:tetratricopeptide (TPR) repeat protein
MQVQIPRWFLKRPAPPRIWRCSALVAVLTVSLPSAPHCQQTPPASTQGGSVLGQAKQAEQKHDFMAAARLYQGYLKLYPNEAEILQRLGLNYYLSSHFDQAIPPFQKAVRINPSLWGSHLFLGISYYRTGRFDKAAESLRKALALNPNLPEANFWYGATLLAMDEPELAIPYLRRASQSSRLKLESESTLTEAYQKAADRYEQRIVKLYPESSRAHELLAESLQSQGHANAALLEYKRALEAKPDLKGAHRARGELYWQRRDFEMARREFEAELRLNPADDRANLRLGEYWLAKGKAGPAVQYLRAALQNHTSQAAEAWHFLGVAELAEHHLPEAEAALQNAVKADPEIPSNYQLLMQDYQRMGRPHEAQVQKDLFEKFSALQKAKSTKSNAGLNQR